MKISIENLPPIASGNFDVRPLTIFIGPNNTGKSRAGLLAYACARALDRPFVSSAYPRRRELFIREPDSPPYITGSWDLTLENEFLAHVQESMSQALTENLTSLLGWGTSVVGQTESIKIRYTGIRDAEILVEGGAVGLKISSSLDSVKRISAEWHDFLESVGKRYLSPNELHKPPDEVLWESVRRNDGFGAGSAHYLPAGRGAFADSWSFYAGLALQRAGAEDARLPLPAYIGDYLRSLLQAAYLHAIAKGGDDALTPTIDFIEREILNGRVAVAGSPSMPFPLIYSNIFDSETDRFDIDLAHASSSVSEVGPFTMLLKTLIKRGDLVVIDEPEAHLHPENERRIARALVRLAASGVTVVAPTHSHTIVHEVGNLIRVARLDESKALRLGYREQERITPSDVGVYVFRDDGQGVRIEEVAFDDEFGYPEETFFEVAHEQSLASHRIDLATAESSAG